MKLYIGNKNYSSWSLRPWLLLKQAGIAFEEELLTLDPSRRDAFKATLAALGMQDPPGPAGFVPVLAADDGFVVWDSLAICEYVAEAWPDRKLWPDSLQARARARSLCAEMHGGYTALRQNLCMNVANNLAEAGAQAMQREPALAADVERIDALWQAQLRASGGPFLFGRFSVADAFFAPVCTRFRTYDIGLSAPSRRYAEHILSLAPMQAWTWDAMASREFIADYEPYRQAPEPPRAPRRGRG